MSLINILQKEPTHALSPLFSPPSLTKIFHAGMRIIIIVIPPSSKTKCVLKTVAENQTIRIFCN